jgi:hypothetical protein
MPNSEAIEGIIGLQNYSGENFKKLDSITVIIIIAIEREKSRFWAGPGGLEAKGG